MSFDLSNEIMLLDPEFSHHTRSCSEHVVSAIKCPNAVIVRVVPLTAYAENYMYAHMKPLRGPATYGNPLWSSSGRPHGLSG